MIIVDFLTQKKKIESCEDTYSFLWKVNNSVISILDSLHLLCAPEKIVLFEKLLDKIYKTKYHILKGYWIHKKKWFIFLYNKLTCQFYILRIS